VLARKKKMQDDANPNCAAAACVEAGKGSSPSQSIATTAHTQSAAHKHMHKDSTHAASLLTLSGAAGLYLRCHAVASPCRPPLSGGT
jgi:hypothetical protein